jgi:hypothetical protein
MSGTKPEGTQGAKEQAYDSNKLSQSSVSAISLPFAILQYECDPTVSKN